MASVLRAAIVGLGQVGSRFDEEPRPSIWSHAGAYLALPNDFALVGGADPLEDQRVRFQKRAPAARVFADPVAMVREIEPDILSVCTPPAGRAALVSRLLDAWRPKVLVCEKPLELDDSDRKRLVDRCATANVTVLVNYTRRFEAVYRAARRAIAAGEIGRVVSVTVRAPNRLWSIGSHAVNLLAYLAGELPSEWSVQPLPALEEAGEPAANVLFRFPSGATGALLTMGTKDVLVLEADVVGESGRVVVTGNGERAVLTPLESSSAFVGYRVPGTPHELASRNPSESPFVALVEEAANAARGSVESPTSTGADALRTDAIVESIVSLCRGAKNE